jgi:hypothetical protein
MSDIKADPPVPVVPANETEEQRKARLEREMTEQKRLAEERSKAPAK